MNENPHLIDLNHGERYPEVLAVKRAFINAVATHHATAPELVLPNNGSNGSLLTILSAYAVKAFSEQGRPPRIILDTPNYFRTTHLIREFRYDATAIPRDVALEFDCDAFMQALRERKQDIVMLTTPNNPTGKPIPDEDLDRILEALPDSAVAVMDRTLINLDQERTTKMLLTTYADKNIVVLHSFSKTHQLSDKRVGYALTNNLAVAQFLRGKLNLGFNVDALRLGIDALANPASIEQVKDRVRESLEELSTIDGKNGITYIPSQSNYAVLRLPAQCSASALVHALEADNIAVMNGNEIGLGDTHIRVHMTGKKEMQLLAAALGNYFTREK